MPSYCLSGLHIASDFVLPGAAAWNGDADADVDVRIVAGPVPERLEGASGTRFQVSPSGTVRSAVTDVGVFLVAGGRHVTVAAAPGVREQTLGLFLLGSVFGFLCHQRGLFPLHASTVEIAGRAFAFAGDSGAGKSTTAAALLELGHTLLSDDISVIDLSGAEPMILPASPMQKLWRDSLDALDLTGGALIRSSVDRDKFERRIAQTARPEARPLARICFLDTAPDGDTAPLFEPVAGAQAMQRLRRNVYRLDAAQAMGAEGRIFLQSAAIASAVPHCILRRPSDLGGVRAFAANISQTLADTVSTTPLD